MSGSLWGEGIAWLIGMSAGCTAGPTVCWLDGRIVWAVSLAQASQLPFSRLWSGSGHESDSCKQHYIKYRTFNHL